MIRIDRLNERAWALRRTDPDEAHARAEEARNLSFAYPKGRAESLLTLAFCAVDRLEFDEARRLVDDAVRTAEAAQEARAEARADFVLGFLQTRLGDFNLALESHQRSLARFAALGDRQGEANVLLFTAGTHVDRGEFGRASDYVQACMTIFDELGDVEGRAQALLMWAIVQLYFGEYTEGLRANHEALALKEELGDVIGQVSILNNLGGYYAASGADDRALENYLEGLRRVEQLANASPRVVLLTNIAEALKELGDFERALHYALEVLSLNESLGRKRDQVNALDTLGAVELAAGRDDRALSYLERALALSEAIGEVETRVFTLAKLAQVFCHRGDLPAARERYAQGLELAQRTQNSAAETDLRLGLARSLTASGELSAARAHLERALALSRTLKLRRQERQIYEVFSETFEREGRLAEALDLYRKGHDLERALSGERANDKTRRLTAQFELERISRDVEIERLRNVELVEINAALQATIEENAALVSQLRDQTKRLEQQTREDALTGLHNRRHLETALQDVFSAAKRYLQPLSVALIDLDNFKAINDTLSHQIGDEVLRMTGRIFTTFVRGVDIVARYGGEEFALVLPQTTAEGARAVCERIREAVEAHPWSELHPDLSVTVSIGVSDDLSVKDHEKLLTLADDKLYRAKREGKNRVIV